MNNEYDEYDDCAPGALGHLHGGKACEKEDPGKRMSESEEEQWQKNKDEDDHYWNGRGH